MKKILFIISIFTFTIAFTQDTIRNKKGGGYFFKVLADIETTHVQNQSRTSTCWSFSSLSFFESELLRMGKGKHNLSEMFIVRHAYIGKADMYVRMNGFHNFGPGGAFLDIPWVIKRHGVVPESVYQGLNYGADKHNHKEMDAILKSMVDVVTSNPQGHLTTSWKNAFSSTIDAYLGKIPNTFVYENKTYTPKTFSDYLGLNMDDYVSITSFTHHPYNTQFTIEVPDNWAMMPSYNVSLSDLETIAIQALEKGYSWAWGADVSEKGFSFKNGLAIVPVHDSLIQQTGRDNKGFNEPGATRVGTAFDQPMEELQISDSLRQKAFDNYLTTDDHGMHVVGIVVDQKGNKYFKVKNSWGTVNDCGGYLYCSMSYFKYKTINIFVHKNALPKDIAKKLNISQSK